jgi:tetratricopeptide (TPR) repeat protein
MDMELLNLVFKFRPSLGDSAAKALVDAGIGFATKLAVRVFRGGPTGAQQRALRKAIVMAVMQIVQEVPELGQISFFTIIYRDDIVDEIQKLFEPEQAPDPTLFQAALEEAGYDCSTLPRTPEDILSRLVGLLRQQARQDPELQPLLNVAISERTLARTENIASELTEVKGLVIGLHSSQKDLEEILTGLEVDYAADIEKARTSLKASRFVRARELLEQIKDRKGFEHANVRTRGETYRLLGLACARLGEHEDAQQFFAQAMALDPSSQKLRLNKAELDLRCGKVEDARRAAEEVLQENDQAWDGYRLLAAVVLERGDVALARKHLSSIQESDDAATPSLLAACEAAEGHYSDALDHVDRALQVAPNDPFLLLQKGSLQLQSVLASPGLQSGLAISILEARRADLENARRTLEAAVQSWDERGLKEYSAEARIQLATVLSLLGDHAGARTLAEEATACRNADAKAWVTRARCELETKNVVAAENSVRRALQDSPTMPAAVTLAALIRAEKGDYEEAAKDLENAPIDAWSERERLEAKLLLAQLLWSAGDHEKAVTLVDNLPAELRKHPRAIVEQAQYLLKSKRLDESRALLENAINERPNEPVLFNIAGDVCFEAGDYRSALRRYSRAIRLAPNPGALAGLVVSCLRLGRAKAALKLLDYFERKSVMGDELVKLRAGALYSLGQIQDASDAFEDYIRRQPDDLAALHNATACYIRLGQRDKAIGLLERLTETKPDDWRVYAQLAQLHFAEGRNEEAFRWAGEALAKGREQPEAHLLYVWIGLETGHGKEAAPVLQELPQKFPDFPGLRRVTIPEARELLRQSQERAEKIRQAYQDRELPITVAAHQSEKPLALYRVLLRRTSLPFFADSGTKDGQEGSFKCCESASEVVIDYPALLTLAQGDMFGLAPKCFAKIYVPSDIRQQIQTDRILLTSRLSYLRERRQRAICDKLKRAGILDAWREFAPDLAEWPMGPLHQDKYLCEQAGAIYLADWSLIDDKLPAELPKEVVTSKAFVEYQWSKGTITRDQYQRAKDYLRDTGNWDGDETPIPTQQPEILVVERFTLSTWETVGLLGWLLEKAGRVLVGPLTTYLLNQDVLEEQVYEEALGLVDLIEAAMSPDEGVFVVGDPTQPIEEPDCSWKSAIALAAEKGLPLWSDDLLTKSLFANETRDARSFSTRTALDLARKKSLLAPDKHHEIVVNLMRSGFEYCWFNSETLVWSLHRHNYQPNEDTAALLEHRGNPDSFDNVAANVIAEMARLHDATREPNLAQVNYWMRHLSKVTSEGSAGVTCAFVAHVSRRLADRSWAVRTLWNTLVGQWEAIGWIRIRRGLIEVPPSASIRLWLPGQGTSV